jgi:hypothetical protein
VSRSPSAAVKPFTSMKPGNVRAWADMASDMRL